MPDEEQQEYAGDKQPEKHLPPDLRLDGPSLSSDDVAAQLGMTKQWVLKLAKRDPAVDYNYLPGYVKNPGGAGWKRKTIEGRNREVYFYEEDIRAYEQEHPVSDEKDLSAVEVVPELYALIQQLAQAEIEQLGYARLTGIRDQLIAAHGYSDRVYIQVRRVAQLENWPLNSRQEKNIGAKRKGRKLDALKTT
jgi:hypothetical protein